MQWIKEQAELHSGVTSKEAQDVSDLYEKVGEPVFRKLSVIFYDKGGALTAAAPSNPPSSFVHARRTQKVLSIWHISSRRNAISLHPKVGTP